MVFSNVKNMNPYWFYVLIYNKFNHFSMKAVRYLVEFSWMDLRYITVQKFLFHLKNTIFLIGSAWVLRMNLFSVLCLL